MDSGKVSQEAPTISLESAKSLLDQGTSVLFVDVRPRSDYERSHIPGAVSLPLRELPQQYRTLPKDHLIITY